MANRVMVARAFIAAALATVSATGTAQAPRGSESLSPGAIAESLVVLGRLTERVRSHPNEFATWHQLGMVAWALTARALADGPLATVDPTRVGRVADSSLRIAAELAPDSVNYRIEVGKYLLASGQAISRTAARGQFQRALDAARTLNVPERHAEAALWLGRTYWWRYDAGANRRIPIGQEDTPRSVTDAMRPINAQKAEMLDQLAQLQAAAEILMAEKPGSLGIGSLSPQEVQQKLAGTGLNMGTPTLATASFKAAREVLKSGTAPLSAEVSGAIDFEQSYALFHEAYSAAPNHPGTFRALAMVYADRGLWANLESLARNHLRDFSRDSLAWMSLGLATHRQQKESVARAAFDSGLATLGEQERKRLDNWERILRPGGEKVGMQDSESSRSSVERLYFALANPVWSHSTGTKSEFLARVAYSELRWTLEEFNLSGADTDRGEYHVRYGPPSEIAVIGPRASESADVTTFWLYDWGLMLAFRGMPTFGTAHLAGEDGAMIHSLKDLVPARWDNIPSPKTDSLATQVARFRNAPGSVDVIVAARLAAPSDIRSTMSIVADVWSHFWIIDPASLKEYRSNGVVDTAGVYTWSQRINAATFLYRVEEFGQTATRAGRAVGALDAGPLGFPPLGFGISDVLLATKATLNTGSAPRVTNMDVSPVAGTVLRGSNLAIVWENYEFQQREGQAQYTISLTVERQQSTAGRIAAEVLGAVAQAARIERGNDRIVISFDRALPHAPAFADQITLNLGETPAGAYKVTLELTDRVTGKTTSRTTTLTIAN